MKNGWIKVAAASPRVTLAKPMENAKMAEAAIRRAEKEGAKLLVLPELFLTGYSIGDLVLFNTLISEAEKALSALLDNTKDTRVLTLVGMPVAKGNSFYNCAVAIFGGRVLGVIPKAHMFDGERRCFASAPKDNSSVRLCGFDIPFGIKQLFTFREMPSFILAVEICNDMWVNIPPSAYHVEAGATVIANLSASPEYTGKEERRLDRVRTTSARSLCGYVYASAGEGESTTDLVFSGHNIIAECGEILADGSLFASDAFTVSEIDCERIQNDRRRNSAFVNSDDEYAFTECVLGDTDETLLTRTVEKLPFVSGTDFSRVLEMQARGLARRVEAAGAKTLVIGISGGLDSCLALLVAIRACEICKKPPSDVLAVTMPCFGTSGRTKSNAEILCEELSVTLKEVDIKNAVKQHFSDIGQSSEIKDVTFENSQARERTQVLMDLANLTGGIVVGTGDLSELALGFATYNGDHMSMYGVNASVPKTLIRAVVRYAAEQYKASGKERLAASLIDVVNTPVSPELLPPKDGEIAQVTEDIVGPYELHDFFIYHLLVYGFSSEKIYRLACYAFKNEYDGETVKRWLTVFLRRFMTQQFKRSCLPDGPKVTPVSLSPRGEFAMPSDVGYGAFVIEAENL